MPVVSISQGQQQKRSTAAHRAILILRSVVLVSVWIAILFLCAGTLLWARGWLFMGTYVVTMAGVGWAAHHWNPGLIEARMNWRHRDTKRFDKIFTAINLPVVFCMPGVAALDVVRFHHGSTASWTAPAGVALFVLGCALVTWALAVNRWAEYTVRIQLDRGHRVVRTGPYGLVRHPMYVGALGMFPGMALMLGSRWALGMAAALMLLMVWRTGQEDKALRRELPGYEEYTATTRYRLLPGVW